MSELRAVSSSLYDVDNLLFFCELLYEFSFLLYRYKEKFSDALLSLLIKQIQ